MLFQNLTAAEGRMDSAFRYERSDKPSRKRLA
jgi:hypothetical protein